MYAMATELNWKHARTLTEVCEKCEESDCMCIQPCRGWYVMAVSIKVCGQ